VDLVVAVLVIRQPTQEALEILHQPIQLKVIMAATDQLVTLVVVAAVQVKPEKLP
jgi:hypothetical protein